MEEWLDFVETFSPYVLHDLPWKPEDKSLQDSFSSMWTHLRRSILICLRPLNAGEGGHAAAVAEVKDQLQKYAWLAQKVLCPLINIE